MKNDIEVKVAVYGDFEKKNLANVFIAGFNPQELLTGREEKGEDKNKKASDPLWKQVITERIDKGESISDVWWQMGIILILESVLALFAGFILLAGAIMFIAPSSGLVAGDNFFAHSLFGHDSAKYEKIFRYVVELSYRSIIFRSRLYVYVYVGDNIYKQQIC